MELGNWKNVRERLLKIDSEIFMNKDRSKLSELEIRRTIYDYLCDHIEYDYDFLSILKSIKKGHISGYERNPYRVVENVLFGYKGVCNGIAQVYRLLLEMNNIYSLCVICDNGQTVEHQLNLVYDTESSTYSFDDVTSVIMNMGTKDEFFGYDREFASYIGQGNKNIMNDEDGEWTFLPAAYLDRIVGRKSDFYKQFSVDNGYNWHLPSNIKRLSKDNQL